MIAFLLLLAPVQESEEETDWLEWARAIDEADLSWWPDDDIGFELSGTFLNEFHFFGDEPPGLTVEDPSYRTSKHHIFHRRSNDRARSPEWVQRTDAWLEAFFGDYVRAAVQGRVDRGPLSEGEGHWSARMEQGFLGVGVPEFTARAGKFSAPIGNFMPRHDPRTNPFVTFPLPYDQLVTLEHADETATRILGRRDRPDKKDWRTFLWREMYGYGVELFGSGDDWEYAVAMMTEAPASWPAEWERRPFDFVDPNVMARVAFKPKITTKIGVSASHGGYQKQLAGVDGSDVPQTLIGLDYAWEDEDWAMWAEVFHNRFETTVAGNLNAWAYYVEARYKVEAGLFVAGRLGQMFFDEIRNAGGGRSPWDRDVTRLEFGAGYFFTRNFWIKGTVGDTWNDQGRDPDDWIASVQVGLGF